MVLTALAAGAAATGSARAVLHATADGAPVCVRCYRTNCCCCCCAATADSAAVVYVAVFCCYCCCWSPPAFNCSAVLTRTRSRARPPAGTSGWGSARSVTSRFGALQHSWARRSQQQHSHARARCAARSRLRTAFVCARCKSILSPGQGWHRRANAQRLYKSPLTGNRTTKRRLLHDWAPPTTMLITLYVHPWKQITC